MIRVMDAQLITTASTTARDRINQFFLLSDRVAETTSLIGKFVLWAQSQPTVGINELYLNDMIDNVRKSVNFHTRQTLRGMLVHRKTALVSHVYHCYADTTNSVKVYTSNSIYVLSLLSIILFYCGIYMAWMRSTYRPPPAIFYSIFSSRLKRYIGQTL